MTIRLETEHIKGKASCLPIQEELNDNPYINGKPEGIGYICKNQKEENERSSYVNTIHDVERITGFTFFPSLPLESAKHAKGIVSPILSSQFQ